MSHPKIWIKVALLNFLFAISIGAILRYAFVSEISWLPFKHFLHAHSHVAMLGWVYQALFAFLVLNFIPSEKGWKKFSVLFWITQLTVFGMLVSFCIKGYSGISIAFSTFHMLLSYVFVAFFIKDTWAAAPTTALRFVRVSLFFLIVSTVALWGMIPIMKMQLQGEVIYYMAIQFYLHFQFNGWFIFAILGLIFKIFENHQFSLKQITVNRFLIFLISSCFLTYALAVTWADPLPVLFYINSSGVILQLLALGMFLQLLRSNQTKLKKVFSAFLKPVFAVALGAFFLKIIIQTAVVIPQVATIAYTLRNFAMGFLHLMLIGMVSFFLIGLGYYQRLLETNRRYIKTGFVFFLIGFLGSEFLLFFQGLLLWTAFGFLPYYYELLFCFSAMLPSGVFLLLFGQFFPLHE